MDNSKIIRKLCFEYLLSVLNIIYTTISLYDVIFNNDLNTWLTNS